MAESLVLAGAGGALALLIGTYTPRLLLRLLPDGIREGLPFLEGTSIGWRTLAATVAVAAFATALFALVPAAQLRLARLQDGLVEGTRGATGTTWRRFGFRLVALELATATVLLTGAGLLGRSLARLLDVDLGFRPDRLVATYLAAPDLRYPEVDDLRRLGREVESEVARLPGVRSAGLVSILPVSFNGNTLWIRFEGRPYTGEHNEVNFRDISAGYLETIGATLVRGRAFTEADTAESPPVALVNQALVRQYFGEIDPIGQRFGDTSLTPESIREIVGVVADVRDGALDAEIWPAVYFPFDQSPDGFFAVVARTEQEPEGTLRSLVAAVREIDAELGTFGEAVIPRRIRDSPVAALRHSVTWLVGGFAALAVLLGAVGLYGVTAYSVGQRTREIGLRLAMGAQRRSVVALVLGETARVTAIGLVLGLAGAVATGVAARALLFRTPPWDLPTLLGVTGVLALVALLASYVPARRAVAVDPMEALRTE